VCGTAGSNVNFGASAVCVEQRLVMLSVGHLVCVCGTASSNVKVGASAVCVEQRVVMFIMGHLLCVWNSE